MAPEIVAGKGYSFYIDLWSTGILLYEFMCGRVPCNINLSFNNKTHLKVAEDADSPYEIYEEIMKSNVKFPDFLKDKSAKKLMI